MEAAGYFHDGLNANVGIHAGILLNARSSWIFFFFSLFVEIFPIRCCCLIDARLKRDHGIM